ECLSTAPRVKASHKRDRPSGCGNRLIIRWPMNSKQESIMKRIIKHVAPWLAAAAVGGSIALAPIASADTTPLVPSGHHPTSPSVPGYHIANHAEADTPNGFRDVPF